MRYASLILIAAAAACGRDPAQPRLARVDEPFQLAVGERAVVGGVSIRFVTVPSDSRCPTTVVCIWEGDGAVLVEIGPVAGGGAADTLHTRDNPRTIDLGEMTLELVRLDPYPEAPGDIPAEEYVATFVVR